MKDWRLTRQNSNGTEANLVAKLDGTIPARGFFLIGHGMGYDGSPPLDVVYSAPSNALTNKYTVLLYSDAGFTLVDKVGFGTAGDFEGSRFPTNPVDNGSIERKPGANNPGGGNGVDTDVDSADFDLRLISDPQNANSPVEPSFSAVTTTTTVTDLPTGTPTHSTTPTGTATATASPLATGTSTATETGTPSPTASASSAPTPTSTATATATASSSPTAEPMLPVVINEVAWAGTAASSSDEWIELYNPNPVAVSLTGWMLSAVDGSPAITLSGSLPADGYFLLERTDDDQSVTGVDADLFYTGSLGNEGETLQLKDALGNIVDTANGDGGAWPAGSAGPSYHSMERVDPGAPDSDSNWASNDGVRRHGTDANGQPINGTPKGLNSTRIPTSTPTATVSPSPSPTSTLTPTPTSTPTGTPTATAMSPRTVIFNEVAWAGTLADANDEWIELRNTAGVAVDLTGYTIDDGGDVHIVLSGVIAPGGFFLLERTDDSATDLPADLIYSGGLSNEGESLTLRDPAGSVVDTANGDGGAWPAGDSGSRATMERLGDGPDSDSNWVTNFGHVVNGQDKDGNPIRGTPRNANSSTIPTPVPTPLPGGVWLNEFLPHPDSDWDDSGSAASDDEFIELVNQNPFPVDVSGYMLDDQDGGSRSYVIPSGTVLSPGELRVFFRSQTGITLNDDGDTVRLLSPAAQELDAVTYGRDPGGDTSWSRLPDGSGDWRADGVPSPGRPNQLRVPPPPPPSVGVGEFRRWPDGAWVTVSGRVTVPPATFGARVIVVQDETGGIVLYLGRGTWPPMGAGQQVQAFGYLRTRTGQRELYVRNLWQVGVGPALEPPLPIPVDSGSIGEALEGWLAVIEGPVVRLETNAFWIDDGSGRARVFFGSASGVERPRVRRGEVWRVVGVVSEYTTRTSKAPGYRLQVRFASDVTQLTDRRGEPLLPVLTGEPEPTDEATATP